MKKTIQTMLLVAVLCLCMAESCEPQAPDKDVEVSYVPKEQTEGARFSVERQGQFRAGYGNNVREILIITDAETGRKYLGVTGVGIAELRSVQRGKSTTTEEE